MDLPLDKGGHQKEEEGQDTQKHIFKVAVEELGHQDHQDGQAEHHIEGGHHALFGPQGLHRSPDLSRPLFSFGRHETRSFLFQNGSFGSGGSIVSQFASPGNRDVFPA